MRRLLIAVAAVAFATEATAESVQPGFYICSVEQLASINSAHLEDADPPRAGAGAGRYRFRISVRAERDGEGLIVEEAPYNGPDRSLSVWEDDNSTLHAPYVGSDYRFDALGETPGFLRFTRDLRWGDDLQFYHAGFEFAGGEDMHLSVRWGRCTPE
jgi:hypothetical protein